jgi:hypothetical protein
MQVDSSSQKAPQATFDFSDLKPHTNAQLKKNAIQTIFKQNGAISIGDGPVK